MARKVIVVALVLVAIFGMVSAEAPKATKDAPAAAAPANDDAIGNDDNGAVAGAPTDVVPGPLGSGSAAAGGSSAAEAPGSGASALEVSALAGVAAVAGYFVF